MFLRQQVILMFTNSHSKITNHFQSDSNCKVILSLLLFELKLITTRSAWLKKAEVNWYTVHVNY